VSLPALGAVPDIQADWSTLADSAADLKAESTNARDALLDAKSSWTGLRTGYRHDGTSERVWAGLDPLEQPAEDWAAALASAKDAIHDFVTTGEPLQRRREALEDDRAVLAGDRSSALTSGDEAEIARVRARILAFNEDVAQLERDWDSVQDTLASALGAVSRGTTEGLAVVDAPRHAGTQGLDWAAMTSELDTRFGELDPRTIWRDLRGLSGQDLRDWLEANPEAARALAENAFPRDPVPGSAEDRMARAMSTGDVAGIRQAWLDLEDHERERLMLLFPGVIGNLNGVPLATRARTHQVTVAGFREQTAERLAGLGQKPSLQDYLDGNTGSDAEVDDAVRTWQSDLKAWQDEHDRLTTVQSGLDQAWLASQREHFPADHGAAPGYATIFISTEGNGQIATMRGTPSASTQVLATFVPGTNTTIASVDGYNRDLNAMDGDEPDTVSIYWQGTDLPQRLIRDNATAHYNEQGAPLLAVHDAAVDLEVPRDARTTYIGHSAGGSLLGTGEREGLDSTNIVYVAPAGNGHQVSSPADTQNEDAHRYLVQTNDDPISWAQAFGGGAQSGSFWEGSNPVHQMGAVRLETGFTAEGELVSGHTDYFHPESVSALNIEGVVLGTEVIPYVQPEVHVLPGSPYPVIEYPLESDRQEFPFAGLDRIPVSDLEG
jgi:hypothetical protein